MKADFLTLGCKLNFAETSTIASLLQQRGVERVKDNEIPDIVVVNTCSVTAEADKKCRQLIRSIHRHNPGAAIFVTGCYAQLNADTIAAMDGVEIVAGNDRKDRLCNYIDKWIEDHTQCLYITPTKDIDRFSPACSQSDRTRHFLKVQDGCDYWCSYCTIPKARGRSRSGTIDDLVKEASKVAEEGGKEIVLTGVNIGDFGKGRDDSFFDLIKALDKVEGIERYRISSIEPNLLTPEIIEWVASSARFMPHFHIPLQAGSDEVLKLMRRRYDTSLFASRIKLINELIPDAFIGVDLIAGMRGETRDLFDVSKGFVESLGISRLHVFPYSERPGTRALDIDHKVSQEEKHRRVAEMMEVSNAKQKEFASRFLGTTRKVLLEHSLSDGVVSGFTDNYLRVNILVSNPDKTIEVNNVVDVNLDNLDPKSLEINGSIVL